MPPQTPDRHSSHSFRPILRLTLGDLVGKSLHFLAFVYLARTLGVGSYGVLEFALSALTYFLYLADGGLEAWATREAARGGRIRSLAGRVLPLRLAMSLVAFGLLAACLPLLPPYRSLDPLLLLFGLTLLPQAVNLRWALMGRQEMSRVAVGQLVAQAVFAMLVVALVRNPAGLLLVAGARLAGDVVMVVYFARRFALVHGGLRLPFSVAAPAAVLRPALTIGISRGLGLLMYNFDSLLLGFLAGAAQVGLYGVAYKPVTVAIALPATYFVGLFPLLSRSWKEGPEAFSRLVRRSLRWSATVALPIGVGGTFLASPLIRFLFGAPYIDAVPALQLLCWSAVLVVLRGTHRWALQAAGLLRLDLVCASVAVVVNVALNLVLIPRYGIVGAAAATVAAEAVWLVAVSLSFHWRLMPAGLLAPLGRATLAAVPMAGALWLASSLFWMARGLVAVCVYLLVLLAIARIHSRKPPYR